MDYNEKIKQLEAEIKELKELQTKESLNGAPNVVGKFFKPFGNCAVKVIFLRSWDKDYNDVSIDCESVNISKDSINIDLDTFYNDINLGDEITKEEYYEWYDKAIEFINKLKT